MQSKNFPAISWRGNWVMILVGTATSITEPGYRTFLYSLAALRATGTYHGMTTVVGSANFLGSCAP